MWSWRGRMGRGIRTDIEIQLAGNPKNHALGLSEQSMSAAAKKR